jgi:uncharacterized protein YyaL (SSP411 family)
MANAAIALYEASSEPRYLEQAEAWVRVMERHYAAPDGGFYLSAGDTEGLVARPLSASDSAVPSGNGAALQALARIYALTGENNYRDKATAIIRAFSGELDRDSLSMATYLNGIDLLLNTVHIVIVGDRGTEECKALIKAVYCASVPNRVMQVVRPGHQFPPGHPAHGKTQLDGKATVYLCRGQQCSLPIVTPFKLEQELRSA